MTDETENKTGKQRPQPCLKCGQTTQCNDKKLCYVCNFKVNGILDDSLFVGVE